MKRELAVNDWSGRCDAGARVHFLASVPSSPAQQLIQIAYLVVAMVTAVIITIVAPDIETGTSEQ